jgi:hypothetical protein
VRSMVENETTCKVPGALTTDLIRELWRDVVEEETIMVHEHGAVNDVAPGHFAPHSASEQNNGRRWTRPLPSAEGIEQGSCCDGCDGNGCDGCDGSGYDGGGGYSYENSAAEFSNMNLFEFWPDKPWLTPGSVVMHSFSLSSARAGAGADAEDTGGRLRDIARIAKSIAKGKTFDACAAEAGHTGEEPPVFLSKGGLTVRVHCDGSTIPVRELDPAFRSQTLSSCHVTASSPDVRFTDITIPGVPPGVKFEGRFHGWGGGGAS